MRERWRAAKMVVETAEMWAEYLVELLAERLVVPRVEKSVLRLVDYWAALLVPRRAAY